MDAKKEEGVKGTDGKHSKKFFFYVEKQVHIELTRCSLVSHGARALFMIFHSVVDGMAMVDE